MSYFIFLKLYFITVESFEQWFRFWQLFWFDFEIFIINIYFGDFVVDIEVTSPSTVRTEPLRPPLAPLRRRARGSGRDPVGIGDGSACTVDGTSQIDIVRKIFVLYTAIYQIIPVTVVPTCIPTQYT